MEQITGIKKRQQIKKANNTMLLWVIIASVVVTVCLVIAQYLVQQLIFNQKVISAKADTNAILTSNIKTFETIKLEVNKLVSNQQLSNLRVAESDTALQVIVDALPTSDDRAALATSLQSTILSRSGVSIESLSVTGEGGVAPVEDDGSVPAADDEQPIEIPFSVTLVGNYAQITQAVADMEHSIRPILIDRLQVEGSGDRLRATIAAKTYYLPARSVELKTQSIKL